MKNRDRSLIALGRAIRDARLKCDMTIAQLAQRMGYSKSMISQVENGINAISLGQAFVAARILGLDLNKIANAKPRKVCPRCKGKGHINE